MSGNLYCLPVLNYLSCDPDHPLKTGGRKWTLENIALVVKVSSCSYQKTFYSFEFEYCVNLSCQVCQNLSILVLAQFEFRVLSQLDFLSFITVSAWVLWYFSFGLCCFLSCVTIWDFEFCHTLSWVLSLFEFFGFVKSIFFL